VLYAPRDAFEEWRVPLASNLPSVEFRGLPYAPLNAIPGFKAKVDFSTLTVDISFSAEAFAATQLKMDKVLRQPASPVLPSVFVNYDLNYAASSFKGASSTRDLGIITEIGLSTSLGVLTMSHSGRNLSSDTALGNDRQWTRLETTFTRDFPDRNQTLRLGDTTTRAGLMGRNAYFGGLQFGTNFALTPGFVRQPLPRLQGLSAAPSTVEMYVNDVLRQVSNVPTGPFTLDNFPVMSGGGEARLVVRDILGRETVIVQSFLTSPQLLAPGLDDWSLEAGRVRNNLGTSSRRYGGRFASLTWSRGITDALTLEFKAEATDSFRLAGIGAIGGLPAHFIGRAAFAASRSDTGGTGRAWMFGAERQGLRSGISFELRGASREFRQLGLDPAHPATKLQAAANWTWATEGGLNFGLGFARIDQFDASPVTTVSTNAGMRVFKQGQLTLNATRAISGGNGTGAGLTFTLPLANQRTVSSSLSHRGGQSDAYVSAVQNPVSERDLGWRLLAGTQQGDARAEGGAYYQGARGVATADASVAAQSRSVRLGVRGGLVFADRNLFVTRRIDDSFAVAEVAGFGNVGIGIGNNMIARTDGQGIALIPRLMPYQSNAIRLDPRELPLNAEIDSIEQAVVPGWRSAVKVVFPVRSGRGALVRIVFDDGQPAPPGALVNIVGEKESFYVARRGEAFVTGLKQKTAVELKYGGQSCSFEINLPPPKDDEYPRVGPLQCKGVKR
jgi:outer membrane usher protein